MLLTEATYTLPIKWRVTIVTRHHGSDTRCVLVGHASITEIAVVREKYGTPHRYVQAEWTLGSHLRVVRTRNLRTTGRDVPVARLFTARDCLHQ